MAIFSNSDSELKSNQTDSSTTIITAGARIKGEIKLECNLYIDGELDGEIHSKKEVNIGKNGRVSGVINTHRLVVQGLVEGTVNADRVEIKAAGHVKGEISSLELVIESKGIFEGNSIVKQSEDSKNKKTANLSKS
jgi:cytoskeletal protein CcmA (bactofilin family)